MPYTIVPLCERCCEPTPDGAPLFSTSGERLCRECTDYEQAYLDGTNCGCSWTRECSGTGVLHCSPPCGGDQCICTCGGESECPGCESCVATNVGDIDAWLDDDAAYDRWLE